MSYIMQPEFINKLSCKVRYIEDIVQTGVVSKRHYPRIFQTFDFWKPWRPKRFGVFVGPCTICRASQTMDEYAIKDRSRWLRWFDKSKESISVCGVASACRSWQGLTLRGFLCTRKEKWLIIYQYGENMSGYVPSSLILHALAIGCLMMLARYGQRQCGPSSIRDAYQIQTARANERERA